MILAIVDATGSTSDALAREAWFLLLRAAVLCAVFGVAAFIALRWARHRGLVPAARREHIIKGVIDRCALGPKQAILVVDVGNTLLLLGVTDHSVGYLGEFDRATMTWAGTAVGHGRAASKAASVKQTMESGASEFGGSAP